MTTPLSRRMEELCAEAQMRILAAILVQWQREEHAKQRRAALTVKKAA